MSAGISSSASPALYSRIPSNTRIVRSWNSSFFCTAGHLKPTTGGSGRGAVKLILPRIRLRCNCSSTPGGPAPGENESKQVLDAFFLGKALAETLNERIESTVGEFLSTIGRLQAEQQKQVQEFQDEVLERAKIAKQKAARQAMEAQGLVPKSSSSNVSSSTTNASSDAPITVSAVSDEPTVSASSPTTSSEDQSPNSTDPLLGISIDE